MNIEDDIKHIHDAIGALVPTSPKSKDDEYRLANELRLINNKISSIITLLMHWDPYEENNSSLIDWDNIIIRHNKNFRVYLKQGFPNEAVHCYAIALFIRNNLGRSAKKCAKILRTTASRFIMLHNRAGSYVINNHKSNRELFDYYKTELDKDVEWLRKEKDEGIAKYLVEKVSSTIKEAKVSNGSITPIKEIGFLIFMLFRVYKLTFEEIANAGTSEKFHVTKELVEGMYKLTDNAMADSTEEHLYEDYFSIASTKSVQGLIQRFKDIV